ncbi:MAG: hypothetical protein H7A41_04880 [Chlamydiales bacterium]|nr:hypothetical protein [Chlamydiia bacterium]MCP5504470.1 hypothetical protein [Chlamydiales bacterium]
MDKNLNQEDLKARAAKLESQVDLLEAELTYLNGLLIEVGFPEGIKTLKATAEELLAEGSLNSHEKHLKGY